jgi:NAD(P)-dependent dehydrogenase (short-subunit alcohol dehydrogenase family)
MAGMCREKEDSVGKYADKKAVITGGTIGMGRAIAEALLEEGGQVLVTGRTEANLKAAREQLGPRAHVVRSDAASLSDIAALAALAREKLGRLDALFLNAGFSKLTPFDKVSEAEYDATFATHAKGPYFTVQQLAPLIQDGGAVVFTTSVADEVGYPGMSTYSGAKAALRAFCRGFAAELLPRRIRVNAVSPGFIDTPTMGVNDVSEAERSEFRKLGEIVTPMKRIGSPQEVARAALFLAFDATYTTGAELQVDGGLVQIDLPHPP